MKARCSTHRAQLVAVSSPRVALEREQHAGELLVGERDRTARRGSQALVGRQRDVAPHRLPIDTRVRGDALLRHACKPQA
jgi:hypothetical protein